MERITRPDFGRLRRDEKLLNQVSETLESVLLSEKKQEERIFAAIYLLKQVQSVRMLDGIPTTSLSASKAGIRVGALVDAGLTDLGKLSRTKDYELTRIDGIGERQAENIRRLVRTFVDNYAKTAVITIDPEDTESGTPDLLQAMDRYLATEAIMRSLKRSDTAFKELSAKVLPEIRIRGNVRWLFSDREEKLGTAKAAAELSEFLLSDTFSDTMLSLKEFRTAIERTKEEAKENFLRHSADFYALLEKFGENLVAGEKVYNSLPEKLAAEIEKEETDLSGLNANLRGYQTFGVKYVLHQKKVLLGDEMGLGKTIQALAVMCHLEKGKADGEHAHFLVVCPASVLINWCREIRGKSELPVSLLHGAELEEAFAEWQREGGAAVTSYEMMKRIIDRIDNHMSLDLLVIDEAHYIKNPDAQRTQVLRRITDEAEHILMMSGTPLENKVDEMCSLIEYVQPELAKTARKIALAGNTSSFRETIAPAYLRRVRADVLKELPPICQEDQWLQASAADLDCYRQQVKAGNFMQMRRISFLEPGSETSVTGSAKLERLLQLTEQAKEGGRKIVVFSYFRETIDLVQKALGRDCAGTITGSTQPAVRQELVDRFTDSSEHVLVCQITAGGVGLNIQAASMVIFCEPQIKPSLEMQALSRVYRMGQINPVTVYHLLCAGTVDEAVYDILAGKQAIFEQYAEDSVMADAADGIIDNKWIAEYVRKEHERLLPAII